MNLCRLAIIGFWGYLISLQLESWLGSNVLSLILRAGWMLSARVLLLSTQVLLLLLTGVYHSTLVLINMIITIIFLIVVLVNQIIWLLTVLTRLPNRSLLLILTTTDLGIVFEWRDLNRLRIFNDELLALDVQHCVMVGAGGCILGRSGWNALAVDHRDGGCAVTIVEVLFLLGKRLHIRRFYPDRMNCRSWLGRFRLPRRAVT